MINSMNGAGGSRTFMTVKLLEDKNGIVIGQQGCLVTESEAGREEIPIGRPAIWNGRNNTDGFDTGGEG